MYVGFGLRLGSIRSESLQGLAPIRVMYEINLDRYFSTYIRYKQHARRRSTDRSLRPNPFCRLPADRACCCRLADEGPLKSSYNSRAVPYRFASGMTCSKQYRRTLHTSTTLDVLLGRMPLAEPGSNRFDCFC